MSFSVVTNLSSVGGRLALDRTNASLDRALERLTSGLRINRSSDDAVNLALANKYRLERTAFNVGIQSAHDAINTLQIEDGALSNIGSLLDHAFTLATQSASDTFTGSRSTLDAEFVMTDLNREEFEDYYNGFSNDTLWPLFHFMLGFFKYSRSQYNAYKRVNEFFARSLAPLLKPDDIIWIHDYHLIPLAAELRRSGARQPIGFFLHVPFPNFDVMRALPCYEEILRALAEYDVIGFQTQRDLWSFQDCLAQPEIGGAVLRDGRVTAFGKTFRAEVFPIGIDVGLSESLAATNMGHSQVRSLAKSVGDRSLIIGVDRLDYSKGLELRLRAFENLLSNNSAMLGRVSLLQIAPPTRSGVRTYDAIRRNLEQASGNINGRFADIDWVPIRYLNRLYDRHVLMSLYRLARVGLVTPIRDGMNLVAKEYVASQDPEDPGMLVLSTLAGSAKELTAAVLVNPYDRRGVADGIKKAIEMPARERQERHAEMIAVLRKNDIHTWCRNFISALTA